MRYAHHSELCEMAFPKRQNVLDWGTQLWNIVLGRRVRPGTDDWMLGPIGRRGETALQFIERLALEGDLTIHRDVPRSGLLTGFEDWGCSIDPKVASFYHHTSDYKFHVESLWQHQFGPLGNLVSRLFSQRIQQMNLPTPNLTGPIKFKSELVRLVDSAGQVAFTVWMRSKQETGEMVFYGIYASCTLPSGKSGVKSVFPLPEGSATVIFGFESGPNGALHLVADGQQKGTGFSFLVEDCKGQLWVHFLSTFRQRITVATSDACDVCAEHSMSLFGFEAYRMNYTIHQEESIT